MNIMIERYISYFKNMNRLTHQSNILRILNKIGIEFPLSDEDLRVDLQLVEDVLHSSYEGMAFNETKKISIISDAGRFRVLINLLPELENIYKDFGISFDIFIATLSDLALRANQYYDHHHLVGLNSNSGHWLLRIFYLRIFKLGSLQYELLKLNFGCLNYTLDWISNENKEQYDGKNVLSVHIMEGSDIRQASVEKSLNDARVFFESNRPAVFYCCSWLLYPGNQKLLGKPSNILLFAQNFKTIATSSYKDHAVFSIFGGDINSIPITSLQKRAQKNPEYLGVGVGVIPF